MEKSKKPFFKRYFNLFDIILLAVIAVLAAILLLTKGSVLDKAQSAVGDGTVTYTVELVDFYEGIAENIRVGDKLQDKVKKYELGTVVGVEVTPTLHQVTDYENERIVETPSPLYKTAILTVSAPCTRDETTVTVGGGFDLRVGVAVNAYGPGYYSYGHILAIDRSGE